MVAARRGHGASPAGRRRWSGRSRGSVRVADRQRGRQTAPDDRRRAMRLVRGTPGGRQFPSAGALCMVTRRRHAPLPPASGTPRARRLRIVPPLHTSPIMRCRAGLLTLDTRQRCPDQADRRSPPAKPGHHPVQVRRTQASCTSRGRQGQCNRQARQCRRCSTRSSHRNTARSLRSMSVQVRNSRHCSRPCWGRSRNRRSTGCRNRRRYSSCRSRGSKNRRSTGGRNIRRRSRIGRRGSRRRRRRRGSRCRCSTLRRRSRWRAGRRRWRRTG
jgi:hypothetical protein